MNTLTPLRMNGKAGVPVWGGARIQGRVTKEGQQVVFARSVTWGRHFFRLDAGWSVSGPILAQLDELAVTLLRYLDDTGATWEVGLEDFKRHAVRRDFGEAQFILPRKRWTFTPPPHGPEQLGLGLEAVAL